MPLLSLSTFEFCAQEFEIVARIPKLEEYISVASSECLEKYSVCNHSWSNHFSNDNMKLSEESILDQSRWTYLLNNNVAQMIYNAEPGILEYCTNTLLVERINCIGDKNMNMWAYIALSGGHLKLFSRIFQSRHPHVQLDF